LTHAKIFWKEGLPITMSFSINIDTGGTFTDGFFAGGAEPQTVKVLTTPHDLTVCLADCIKEGAARFGLPVEELLKKTGIIRYSTTIGTNTIIQRNGSKLGLVVTAGFEDNIYGGAGEGADDPLYHFIAPDMITGATGQIGPTGQEVEPLSKQAVLNNVQKLIDQGARAIVVSLYRSYLNPAHEQQIKTIIKEEFPRFYLGSPNVFLASEVSDRPGERLRTSTAVLNAYIHRSMARYLYKAEEDLRQRFFSRPLLVVHNSGGVARVAKTRALSTYNSGPVAGLVGANRLRQMYGLQNIISTDMGGTSLDLGLIRDGSFNLELQPVVAGLPINHAMIEIKAIGAGGGSIARAVEGQVEVGPASAGSLPGPACFDLGGDKPTVTDADLILGFIDPGYFLGGRIKLNRERAVEAVSEHIAVPLDVSVEEAAAMIKQKVDGNIADYLTELIKNCGADWRPEAVLAYGGAGPTHCCGYTARLPVRKIITSPYSPVFSAFGLCNMDVVHKYSISREIAISSGCEEKIEAVNTFLEKFKAAAYRDMRGEGFGPGEINFHLEVFGRSSSNMEEERVLLGDADRLSAKELELLGRKIALLSSVALNAVVTIPHQQIPKYKTANNDPARANTSERQVFWPKERRFCTTGIYRREKLQPGSVIAGPAVIESVDTTCVVPAAYRYTVDEYLNGIIEGVE
jgi:N-methylhydantoinase A/acetophenone carboxylase